VENICILYNGSGNKQYLHISVVLFPYCHKYINITHFHLVSSKLQENFEDGLLQTDLNAGGHHNRSWQPRASTRTFRANKTVNYVVLIQPFLPRHILDTIITNDKK
jgi:hypothetical protein